MRGGKLKLILVIFIEIYLIFYILCFIESIEEKNLQTFNRCIAEMRAREK